MHEEERGKKIQQRQHKKNPQHAPVGIWMLNAKAKALSLSGISLALKQVYTFRHMY